MPLSRRVSAPTKRTLPPCRSRRLHIIGVSVNDTTAEVMTAIVSVSANSRNMRPTMPVMNSSGMNTATSDTVSEITVKPISLAPSKAASNGDSPSSMWRTMFSIMTMASSITKPVPIVSAISDRLSREKPQNHITAKVAMSDSGSATPAMIVARTERRKMNTTITTRATLSTSVNWTSRTDARIVPVRSCTTVSEMPFGIARCRRGSSWPMRRTVSMTFAPGWRCTSMMTAGMPLNQPPTFSFSSPSMTFATSLSMTGEPPR